jgi:hypothetical protein
MNKKTIYTPFLCLLLAAQPVYSKTWSESVKEWLTPKNTLIAAGITATAVVSAWIARAYKNWSQRVVKEQEVAKVTKKEEKKVRVKLQWIHWYAAYITNDNFRKKNARLLNGNVFEWNPVIWTTDNHKIYNESFESTYPEAELVAKRVWTENMDSSAYPTLKTIIQMITDDKLEERIKAIKDCNDINNKKKLLDRYALLFQDVAKRTNPLLQKQKNKHLNTLAEGMFSYFYPQNTLEQQEKCAEEMENSFVVEEK